MPQETKRSAFAPLVVIFAAGLLLGMGLCGLDYFLASRGIGKSTEEFGVGPLDGVSLIVMFLSALGLGITLAAWVVAAIFKSLTSNHDHDSIRPFDKEDKDK